MGRLARTRALILLASATGMVVTLGSFSLVSAQQLPLRHYNVRDGLAHSGVRAIYQDAKGYLWIGTWDGLSRFDGYRFTNYRPEDGLGHPIINEVIEDRRGRLWAATNGAGVARLIADVRFQISDLKNTSFNPQSAIGHRQRFVSYLIDDAPESNNVNTLLVDAQNTLWCLTDAGIYRAAADATSQLKFTLVLGRRHPQFLLIAALADRQGRLWFGSPDGVVQVNQDRMVNYRIEGGYFTHGIVSLVEDRHGRVLAAHRDGVLEFLPPSDATSRGQWKNLPLTLGPGQNIYTMITDETGTLWIGTNKGLIIYRGGQQTVYTTANGLCGDRIRSLLKDQDGNLWIGAGGVCKLSSEDIVSFTSAEGLTDQHIARILEDRQGHIYAITGAGGVAEIVGGKAVPVPGSHAPPFDKIYGGVLQDRRGDWWVGTNESGLFHFRGPTLQFRQGRRVTAADGITGLRIDQLYEDPAGRIWVNVRDVGLFRFDPSRTASPMFQAIPNVDLRDVVTMFIDQSGALWIGHRQGLKRWAHGKLLDVELTEGLPASSPRAIFQDSRGWLWIGSHFRGASMTKDPTAEHPTFVNYSTENGLSSNMVWTITEDDFGRIYLGTEKGLNQFDPSTGRIRLFTTADGLAGDAVYHCMKDRRGTIWVGTINGLSRLTPRAERVSVSPPRIYFSRIQVADQTLSLPERGAEHLPEMTLPAAQNNLRIEYVGLSFRGERVLTYQYKLDGVDDDWNPPRDERSVNYARLSPGSYRFLVRAIHQEGAMSLEPAVFEFRIRPPIWQRWWFVTAAALFLMSIGYAINRYRLAKLLEVERVRTRIAGDLHDDIGASLSEIAVLSEVVRQRTSAAQPEARQLLEAIADKARGLVDTMSDIVWSIDPRRDDLDNVIFRVSDLASDLLEAKGIAFTLDLPPEPEKIRLTPDERRHLYLIFKEAFNNIVRHAQCSRASVKLRIADRRLVAEIADNGCGLPEGYRREEGRPSRGGYGLENMQTRAAEMGGEVQIDSTPGEGMRVIVSVPLRSLI